MTDSRIIDDTILDIIQNHDIKEQKDLQHMLKGLGHDIPQSTLSRRIKKLKIAKIRGSYKALVFPQHHLPLVLKLHVSEFGMLVMHTHPGQAHSVAYFIDRKYIAYASEEKPSIGIIGTIAGDDTVLLILKNQSVLKDVLMALYQDFPYLKKGDSH